MSEIDLEAFEMASSELEKSLRLHRELCSFADSEQTQLSPSVLMVLERAQRVSRREVQMAAILYADVAEGI